jgi:hypothetical protein
MRIISRARDAKKFLSFIWARMTGSGKAGVVMTLKMAEDAAAPARKGRSTPVQTMAAYIL